LIAGKNGNFACSIPPFQFEVLELPKSLDVRMRVIVGHNKAKIVLRLILQQINKFLQIPNVIGYDCFHRWRHAQRLVNPAKIVVRIVERNRVLQILQLFREGIG
jgi:hypothetical protein